MVKASAWCFVVDGIGGLDLCATSLKIVAAGEGIVPRVRTISWGHGFGRWHADLTDRTHHEDKADQIAARSNRFARKSRTSRSF